MPNGHGAHFRFLPVIVLLVFGGGLLVYARDGGAPGWVAYTGYPLAWLIGERIAYHLHRWHAEEHGGEYSTEEEKAAARKTYIVGAVIYILGAMVAWNFLTT